MKRFNLRFEGTFGNAEAFFAEVLKRRFDVVTTEFDTKVRDILIFGDRTPDYNNIPLKYDASTTKIFYTGENVRPTYFAYDHAITFDHENSPRHYRLPLYVLESWAYEKDSKLFPSMDFLNLPIEKNTREKFCTFVVSNTANVPRMSFFKQLNAKKRVESGGPAENNIGYVLPRDDAKHKHEFLHKAKFNICFENGSYPGYVTEKIMNAFAAGTVPIYYGSPTVVREFNPEAFIHIDITNIPAEVDRVLAIDADDAAYNKLLNATPFRDNIAPSYMNLDLFLNWFEANVL